MTPRQIDGSRLGEHACVLYDGREERLEALAVTVRRAKRLGRRILWIGPEPVTLPLQDVLRRVGAIPGRAAGPAAAGRPALEILDPEFAMDSGSFDQDALIQRLRDETVQALDDGFTGLQVIQEIGDWRRGLEDVRPLRSYEAALSTFLPGSSCNALCLYDKADWEPDRLLNLLEIHPYAMTENRLSENIYAISPEDLLELDLPRATLERRLTNLSSHRDAENARKRHTSLVEMLHQVAWAGHEAVTDDEVIQITLERICRHIGWPAGHAYRVDEESGELVPTSLWYAEDPSAFETFRAVFDARRFPLGVGLAGRVAKEREAAWLADVDEEPTFVEARAGEETGAGVRTAFAFPVTRNNHGIRLVFELFSDVHRDPDPDLIEIVEQVSAHLSEVLDRKEAESDLRLLESGVSNLEEALLVMTPDLNDPDGPRIVYANPAIERIAGYAPHEVLGERIGMLFGPKTNRIVRRRADRRLKEGEAVTGELVAYRKDESEFVLQWQLAPVRDGEGRMTNLVAVLRDVTDERRAEEAIRRADHDSLTGLPNRELFMRRLERSVERVQRDPDDRFAVLFMDLDRFKVVNDSLGHLRGDQMLVSLARRIERAVRPGDTVARFGGDEFVILLDRADEPEDVTAIARRIEQELESPFPIGGRNLYTTASIGIALSDSGYTLPEDVLRDADTAMYRAKAKGGGTYEVFDQSLYDEAVSVLRLETELHHAVDSGDFALHYQPIVSLEDGRTLGFEALLRWMHPDRGLLPPAEFLGMAEETGLIIPIGRWVLEEASRQLQSWQDRFQAATHLSLAVNFSAREFGTQNVVALIRKALKDHSLFSGTLQVEITENTLIDRPDRVEAVLRELEEMGVQVCLDDFGTGYSSLSYLHRFPVRILKIDRLFVQRLANGRQPKRNEEIIRAILALARNLEIGVTAEGVETRAQLRRLRRMQCPTAQGFYFSRPLPPERVEELLTASDRRGKDGGGTVAVPSGD